MSSGAATQEDALVRVRRLVGAGSCEEQSDGTVRVTTPTHRLVETCAAVWERLNGRLATMVGLDERERTGLFRLAYVFSVDGRWVSVETTVDPLHPTFPSVASRLPAAHWYEREVHDLLGLLPEGHPDLRRLVLHDDWPANVYPLRKDFDASVPVPRVDGPPHRFHHLHGEGIVEVPVGPIHAGVIEPGHFRFAAVGEVVLHLETRLFYTHRGIEKLAEGKHVRDGVQIAERICGACAASHAVSYCQAIETLSGVMIPARAAALRACALELERLYNHIGDLGNICAGIGFAVGSSQGGRLKEDVQRLNERLIGNRFLRGLCQVGGVRRDFDSAAVRDALETLRRVMKEFEAFVELLASTDSALDRFKGTGIVPTVAARDLGAVGVAARASGIDTDVRRDQPYGAYMRLPLTVPIRKTGDVWARAQVRMDEIRVSFSLLQQLLDDLPAGPLMYPVADVPAYASALGATESPRGENLHWVQTGPGGCIDRYRIRSASYCNWPIVALAVPGNMVPDFPLINKSFELCYACLDR